MGRSKKKKDRGRPDRSLESGTEFPPEGQWTTEGEKEEIQSLEFSLTHLNPAVHSQTAVMDPVRFLQKDGSAEIHTSVGRLGNVPAQAERKATHRGLSGGVVVDKSDDPITARVRLTN